MACVYWLKTKEHTDYNKDGYIGTTVKTALERYNQHKNASQRGSTLVVHRAIKKYGELDIVTLYEGDEESCYLIEEMLRPSPSIGYNLAKGGKVSPTTGVPHSDATKKKISNANKGSNNGCAGRFGNLNSQWGKTRSEITLKKWNDTYSAKKDWEKSRLSLGVWTSACLMYEHLLIQPKTGFRKLAKIFNFPPDSVITINKKLKSGWNPKADQEYMSWLASYNKQKEIASECTSAN